MTSNRSGSSSWQRHRWLDASPRSTTAGVAADDQTDLPRSVSFLRLAGTELGESSETVVESWRANNALPLDPTAPRRKRDNSLRALVGQSASGPMHLDLRTQGPHALVGGTTGAGKSEFLQSWVLGMAAMHSPSRVTFLFVDYKGGAAFADCVDLPHCVGLVTDLSPHLVRRALTSLNAELHHRELILNAKKAKDLLELEKRNDPDTPPSLVIVVDEFAALVTEVPEFVDGVVNVAQRGRSLGLHLILATQRPAGVIKDNLRANTNLRVALRMADEDDSQRCRRHQARRDLRSGSSRPGRRQDRPGSVDDLPVGVRRRPHVGRAAEAEHRTSRPRLRSGSGLGRATGGTRRPAMTAPTTSDESSPPSRVRPTRRRSLRHVGRGCRNCPRCTGWKRLPSARTDARLVFGVRDDPKAQAQPEIAFNPDEDGNMAVYGTGGSGKSTFLRSIAFAASLSPARGGPCHVYGLDFGSRGLQMLEVLPHVGSIIPGDDAERVQRLLRMLKEMPLRNERIATRRRTQPRSWSIESGRAVPTSLD